MILPSGPTTTNAIGAIISIVNKGFAINLITGGVILATNFSTYERTNVIKIIGITDDEYVTILTGIPNTKTVSAVSFKALKLGCKRIAPFRFACIYYQFFYAHFGFWFVYQPSPCN